MGLFDRRYQDHLVRHVAQLPHYCRKCKLLPAVSLAVFLSLVAAISPLHAVTVTHHQVIPIRFTLSGAAHATNATSDLSLVDRCQLWVKPSQGDSQGRWHMVQELSVAAGSTKGPLFRYQVPADGTYLFATRALFRDGQAEPEPSSATSPVKGGMSITVDSQAPQLTSFTASAQPSDDIDRLAITAHWQAADTHWAQGVIEMATLPTAQQAEQWLAIRENLAPRGQVTLTLPRSASLRFVAIDQAGNRTISQRWRTTQPTTPTTQANSCHPT